MSVAPESLEIERPHLQGTESQAPQKCSLNQVLTKSESIREAILNIVQCLAIVIFPHKPDPLVLVALGRGGHGGKI